MAKTSARPALSALSNLLSQRHAKIEANALPLEILHNLQHQHGWRDISIHNITQDNSNPELIELDLIHASSQHEPHRPCVSDRIYLISGVPPRHAYLHPDLQTTLIRRKIPEESVTIQREWVLPMSLGDKWSLRKFSEVFDALPPREALEIGEGNAELTWKDAKRVLMGMLSTNGLGGDGTVVYYIMQEGEVKPRQNG